MQYVADGFCGVYCGACPTMLATKTGKLENDKRCFGCKSEKPTGFCETCGIKACALREEFEFCNQCNKLMICDLMQKFIADQQYPYGQCVLKNMEMIHTTGLSNWLEMQNKRWRCDHCGEPHSWYDENCPKCGIAVINYLGDL